MPSGSYYLEAMNSEEGTKLAHAVLTALDIPAKDVASLARLPLERLLVGLEKTARGPAAANFRPVVDGVVLPEGPFGPDAPALSKDIPMVIGTTATEMTSLSGARDPGLFTLNDVSLKQRLTAWFAADDVDTVIARFRATRPNATPGDIFFAVATDKAMREGAWRQAERKARQGGGKAWLYELDWKTPVENGKWGSPHSLCLALVFDNVALSAAMVGTGPEAQALADQMSGAWLAFARTGDPNHKGIPSWTPYDTADRATMVFDTTSELVKDFRGDERMLLSELKPPR